MYKTQYLIITYLSEGKDLSFYDTKEEALEDFNDNDTDYFQELFEVKKIL